MTEARSRMLASVRSALGRDRLPQATEKALNDRLAHPRANVVPERGRPSAEERIDRFVFEAERVNATVKRLETLDQVPAAVVDYLRSANVPAATRIGSDALIRAVDWSAKPFLQITTGAAEDADTASVTSAFAGVAETGTLVLLSHPDSPTTLNFLPEAHLVILPADRIVGSYEDVWLRLRERLPGPSMPRVINWITGPSRTADIEQTLLLGAHGPKRLHILLVDAACPE
jgi:L-lactate dehydrogenase complex protein LldG